MAVRIVSAVAVLWLVAACRQSGSQGPAPAAGATRGELPLKYAAQPTSAGITEGNLMSRLYVFADDSMQGRAAGTIGNVKGTDYIAAQARQIGLRPSGDGGTYFQTIPLVRRQFDASLAAAVDGAPLTPWRDFAIRDQGPGAPADVHATAVYGGTLGRDSSALIAPDRTVGKVVVFTAAPPDQWPGAFSRAGVTSRYAGAAALMVTRLDDIPQGLLDVFKTGSSLTLKPDVPASSSVAAVPAYLYVTTAVATRIFHGSPDALSIGATGGMVTLRASVEDRPTPYPARNVIGILPGSDPTLAGEFVVIGAHNDHIGMIDHPVDHDSVLVFNRIARREGVEGPPDSITPAIAAAYAAARDSVRRLRSPRPDSVNNGADDDGTGSVALLEIAQALAAAHPRPKRSILFIWHTGEELGTLGSDWFTDHPTVARDSLVTEFNIDMIGRGDSADLPGGGPRYLEVIGARRLSTELGDSVESVNKRQPMRFAFNYQFDADGDPHQYYCRSDHWEYARYGIPIAFFSTGGHPDYHQITDEPQLIDYAHYARVVRYVRDLAVAVANMSHRPVVDHAKPRDPHAACVQ
jgi:hypothetical protein